MNRPEHDHHSRNVRIAGRMSFPLAYFSIVILLLAQPITARAVPLNGECGDMSGNFYCSAAPSQVVHPTDNGSTQALNQGATQDIEPVVADLAEEESVSADQVKAEMQRVFGEDYDKAMMILTHPICHENRILDPRAVHRNWVPGKPGVYSSSDWGVFQINDRAHGYTEAQASQLLTDYKYNIKLAKKLYDQSGGRFRLWTCGRLLGI